MSTTLAVAGPPAAEKEPAPAAGETAGEHRRTVAKFVTFSGLAIVAAGVGLGVYANHEYDEQFSGNDPNCTTIPQSGEGVCNPAGYSRVARARLYGTTGTIVAGVGVVAAATGLVLWLTAPSDREPVVVPTVTSDGGGVAFTGRF